MCSTLFGGGQRKGFKDLVIEFDDETVLGQNGQLWSLRYRVDERTQEDASQMFDDLQRSAKWDERWSCEKEEKDALQEFYKKNEDSVQKAAATSDKVPEEPQQKEAGLRAVSKDGEFRNWAATVQTAPLKVFEPKTAKEVQTILAEARAMKPIPRIRCMGSSHSWSPLFADDGAWLINTKGINGIDWSAENNPTQATVGPGVTGGDLATFLDSKDRGKWRGLFLESDVVLETVTYGGVVNSACHGTGQTKTVCDYVLKTSIIKWDGTTVELKREDDPEGFAAKIVHFGLLGITVGLTFQLDDKRTAIRVTDTKCRAREIFLEGGQLPGVDGVTRNPLLDMWKSAYAQEIFYFAASSLKITNLLSSEFEDQKWDEYNDICAIKTFNRTNKRVSKDDDSFFGKDSKTSTRFDRNFSITDFLKINVGTEVALPLVAKFGDKPALVSLYAKTAAKAFEPAGETTGEVSYETSLSQAIHWQKYITEGYPVSDIEVCIKCDPDFTSAYKAIHAGINIIKRFAEDDDTLPLNVAMEMRFTKHSDSPLCPAYGKEGDVFVWIEVLSAVGTPKLKEFNTKIADAWMAVTLKDGSQAAFPHWAKWSESYVLDAEAKLKRAFASRLPLLQGAALEWDPNGIFMNDFFKRLFETS